MSQPAPLQSLLRDAARRDPDHVAVEEPNGPRLRYGELDELSDRLRDRLRHMGVGPGDRVALFLRKSPDSIAALFGILKTGGAYVPIDPEAPAERAAYIMGDCAVAAVVVERPLVEALTAALDRTGVAPPLLVLESGASAVRLRDALASWQAADPAPATETTGSHPDDLAYILYTSGSTGRPKGVMLTHRAARCFVDWCTAEFRPGPGDVYSSHAPLHFDLSIHDVFVAVKHGARLVLIGEALGKDPMKLARVIAETGITVWYSTPSILNLLATYGRLGDLDLGALRLVLFAGEVFPIPQLRLFTDLVPRPRYYNLFGPTETNVCTAYEVRLPVPADRSEPYPIGPICPPLRGRVVDQEGRDVPAGSEGELVVAGPGVMTGYWNLPEQNARAFLTAADGERWYRTGDLVVEQEGGEYVFHGRRDRMVKRRGYRIELGEIEAGLGRHPAIEEVAVVAVAGDEGVHIRACIAPRPGAQLGVIALKRFSAEALPRYMVPDSFEFLETLPRTSTDKIDYQTLRGRVPAPPRASS